MIFLNFIIVKINLIFIIVKQNYLINDISSKNSPNKRDDNFLD